jgi:SpoVK/Ycf46/Vps4 family AAA+-type ATPase
MQQEELKPNSWCTFSYLKENSQFDGCGTSQDDRILLIGATNRPHEIDEAARRRFTKKLYIPLPCAKARRQMVVHLLAKQKHDLSDEEIDDIVEKTLGYSGSDMAGLVKEAAINRISLSLILRSYS